MPERRVRSVWFVIVKPLVLESLDVLVLSGQGFEIITKKIRVKNKGKEMQIGMGWTTNHIWEQNLQWGRSWPSNFVDLGRTFHYFLLLPSCENCLKLAFQAKVINWQLQAEPGSQTCFIIYSVSKTYLNQLPTFKVSTILFTIFWNFWTLLKNWKIWQLSPTFPSSKSGGTEYPLDETYSNPLPYPQGLCSKNTWMPEIVDSTEPYIYCVFSRTYVSFHWKEALYDFSLAYLDCQNHYSCTLGNY